MAVSGDTVALSCNVLPTETVASVFSSDTLSASTGTSTEQVACKPFFVVAVMTAEPLATAVTRPFSSTVATSESEEVQVTDLIVVLSGLTSAVSCLLSPILTDTVSSEREILSASTFSVEGRRMLRSVKMPLVLPPPNVTLFASIQKER